MPGKEMADKAELFHIKGSQVAILLNNELQEEKGIYEDGQVYLPISWVNEYVNERFYWDETEKLKLEKEGLGFYITGHPLEKYRIGLKQATTTTTAQVTEFRDGDQLTLGGLVTAFRKKLTKKGDQMGFFRLEDLAGAIEVIVVPQVLESYSALLQEDVAVLVNGILSVAEEELPKLRAQTIRPLGLSASNETQCLIEFRASQLKKNNVLDLQKLLLQHHGVCPVIFKYVDNDNNITRIRAGERFAISPTLDLLRQVEQLIGSNCIHVA